MIHFHSLVINKVQKETEDCVSLTFEIPPELEETFRFKQGQNITIRKNMNGEEIRRNYSICSSPFDGILRVAVKKVEGGLFSTYANEELKAGERLDIMPPMGNFNTELKASQKKKYVAFAAGSGITPVLSIIKTSLITEKGSEFTLVFGNRTKNNIIFKEELEALKDKFIDRFRIFHILSRERTDAPINNGRIDPAKLLLLDHKIISFDAIDEFFLCGPDEMIFCIKNYLLEKKIPENRIHFELFTIPGTKKSAITKQPESYNNSGPKAKVSVKL
ncbi:MAG TPA: FAD-binding oxidoreductase, partial [Flavisolibacter sp.]|nr:FAD-binding oxidoreductase [Flavisolibacter sp.]